MGEKTTYDSLILFHDEPSKRICRGLFNIILRRSIMHNRLEAVFVGLLGSVLLLNLSIYTRTDKQEIINAIMLLLFAILLKIIHDLRKKD
jgi:uncharacterized membrane protein